MVTLASDYLKHRYDKPGNVFVGIVSRLDASASGVLVLARTSKAASRLSEQIRNRRTQKQYLAIVEGGMHSVDGDWAEIRSWMAKDDQAQRMRVVAASHPGAQEAILRFRTVMELAANSLVQVDLVTGRKHQIRVQLAASGHPILGDRKYGSREAMRSGIALHCFRSVVEHPTKREPMAFVAKPPISWNVVGAAKFNALWEELISVGSRNFE